MSSFFDKLIAYFARPGSPFSRLSPNIRPGFAAGRTHREPFFISPQARPGGLKGESIIESKMIRPKHLSSFMLLPAKPGTCQECAVKHDESQPHNRNSLYYQYHFYNEHGFWPTWGDALAHCDDDDIREYWKTELKSKGVTDDELKPAPKPALGV